MADEQVVRKILFEIDRDPAISQRRLADEVGVSVGMINWHIKRCVAKGLIKLQQAPLHRYRYYLTPAGFVEKTELTARFLQASFSIFRTGREDYGKLLQACMRNGWTRIVLVGNSELTELALMALMAAPQVDGLTVAGIIDSNHPRANGSGPKIAATPNLAATPADLLRQTGIAPIDAIIVCHFMTAGSPREHHDRILAAFGLDSTRLLIPEFLQ